MIAFTDIYFHFIWRIDENSPEIDNLTERLVEKFLIDYGERFGYECIANAVLPDHIHLFAKVMSGVAPGVLVEMLKSELTKFMTEKLAMQSPPKWDEGYGAVSVSKAHTETIINYVKTQKSRHREGKINDTLERVSS